MRMERFQFNPLDFGNHINVLHNNQKLEGATHVETYTFEEQGYGGRRTIVVFAFFPDKDNNSDHTFRYHEEP